MSRIGHVLFLCLGAGLLLAFTILSESTGAANAQPLPKPATPKVVTADGVRLNVLFYESPKKNAPTVIMLHPVGIDEGIHKPGWKALAETLQKNNFAVAIFDFRGHGESKSIESPDDFWFIETMLPTGITKKSPNLANLKNVRKSTKEGDTIDVKDFIKAAGSYLPVLANDIQAVKSFLDKRHDAGECNTGNTIIIGAESGATLGALFINSQWNCFKYEAGFNPLAKPVIDKRAEGNDIIAAIWLNMQTKVETRTFPITGLLRTATGEHAMPTAFMVGQEDTKAKKLAEELVGKLKPKASKKHDLVLVHEIRKTNLSGVKLLQKGLDTSAAIVEFAKAALEFKSNDWEARNFASTAYGWRNPQTKQFLPAKRKDQKYLQFDSFEKFITQ